MVVNIPYQDLEQQTTCQAVPQCLPLPSTSFCRTYTTDTVSLKQENLLIRTK